MVTVKNVWLMIGRLFFFKRTQSSKFHYLDHEGRKIMVLQSIDIVRIMIDKKEKDVKNDRRKIYKSRIGNTLNNVKNNNVDGDSDSDNRDHLFI